MHNSATLVDDGGTPGEMLALGGLNPPRRDAGGDVELSVVIPTRNEAPNIPSLLADLDRVLTGIPAELIFVDDSDDESPHVIRHHASGAKTAVRVLHREHGRRAGGRDTAVVAGLAAAGGRWVAVMDADLQHPPEVLVELLHRARLGRADVVVASRYRAGGSTGEVGVGRELASQASALAARALFPRRLRPVTDPMSGFFLFRRDALDVQRLRPRGHRILVEAMVRCEPGAVAEVPYWLASRRAGRSKASVREGLRFLPHLVRLRLIGRAA